MLSSDVCQIAASLFCITQVVGAAVDLPPLGDVVGNAPADEAIHSPGRSVRASLTVCTPDSSSRLRSITSVVTGEAESGISERVPVTTITSPDN